MNLRTFQKINADRGRKWHRGDLSGWSLLEWAGAMCGESGEAANYAKKIRRLEIGLPNREAGIQKSNRTKLEEAMAKEVADAIIYGLLTLSTLEVDAVDVIAKVFDQKSVEYGFSERAPRDESELFAACRALIDAPHHDHFASRLGDEELAAVNRIKAIVGSR